jgi:hypothetical protein
MNPAEAPVTPDLSRIYTLFYQSDGVALAEGAEGAVLAVGRQDNLVVLDEAGAMSACHPRVNLPDTLHEGDQIVVRFGSPGGSRRARIRNVGLAV